MLLQEFLTGLTTLANEILRLDPKCNLHLEALQPHCFEFLLEPQGPQIYLYFQPDRFVMKTRAYGQSARLRRKSLIFEHRSAVDIEVNEQRSRENQGFTSQPSGLSTGPKVDRPVTATLQGPWQAFLDWMLFQDPVSAKQAGLQFQGDAEAWLAFQRCLKALDIDWEEGLSKITNDAMAHELSRFIHARKKQGIAVSKSFLENLKEYLEEEARWVPTSIGLKNFYDDVDQLRSDLDRFEKRIQLLEQIP